MNPYIKPISDFTKGILVGAFVVAAGIWFVVLLSGCAIKTYTSPEGAKLSSTTFLWGPEITGLEAQDGNRTLKLQSQKSDVQALTELLKMTVKP